MKSILKKNKNKKINERMTPEDTAEQKKKKKQQIKILWG